MIKATVDAKSKKDPAYKAAFDHHLANQDFSKHAEKARSERKRKDVRNSVGKNARGVNRLINGPFAAPIGAAALVTAVGVARKSGLDQRVSQMGEAFIRTHM